MSARDRTRSEIRPLFIGCAPTVPGGIALRRPAEGGSEFCGLADFLTKRAKRDSARRMMRGDADGEFQGAVCADRGAGSAGEDTAPLDETSAHGHAASCDRPGAIPCRQGSASPVIHARDFFSGTKRQDVPCDILPRCPRTNAPYAEPFPRKKLPSFAPRKAQNF